METQTAGANSTTYQRVPHLGTLPQFMQTHGFTNISPRIMKSRENGYPCIIVSKTENGATVEEWLFLSKKAAARFEGVEDTSTRQLGKYLVRKVENAAGETRMKLCTPEENSVQVTEDYFG